MAIKLHRCSWGWFKLGVHPCWKVQKALDETGTPYEVVEHPAFPPGKRDDLEQLSGQRKLPVLEFDDGRILREESSDMADRIREGRLDQPATAGSS
jgi:glutathione S-transferase